MKEKNTTPRVNKVSKDGKMSYNAKTEINGVKMDWSFIDEIIEKYNNNLDQE